MKKIHLFGLIVIAIAIGIIVSTYGNSSTYSDFREAEELAKEGEKTEIHVAVSYTHLDVYKRQLIHFILD